MDLTSLLEFLLRATVILLSTLALRRAYFTSPLTVDFLARHEALASSSWRSYALACRYCVSFYLAGLMTLCVVTIPWWVGSEFSLWLAAAVALGFSVYLLDPDPRRTVAPLLPPTTPDDQAHDVVVEHDELGPEIRAGNISARFDEDRNAHISLVPPEEPLCHVSPV